MLTRSDTQTANAEQDSANEGGCFGIHDTHPISQSPAWASEQSPLEGFTDLEVDRRTSQELTLLLLEGDVSPDMIAFRSAL